MKKMVFYVCCFMMVAMASCHGSKSDVDVASQSEQKVEQASEYRKGGMTYEQVQNYIKTCDEVLERLQKEIDAEETNPEERFHARRTYKNVTKERAEMMKRLEEMKKDLKGKK